MKGTEEVADIGDDDFQLMLDCKHRPSRDWRISSWLEKVETAGAAEGKYPVLALQEPGKKRTYVIVRRKHLMNFIGERCKGFTNEQFYTWNAAVTPRVGKLKQWDNLMKTISRDKSKNKVPKDAMPMLFIKDIVMLKPEDLARIFRDGGLLPEVAEMEGEDK
jgi:hypothetical protein